MCSFEGIVESPNRPPGRGDGLSRRLPSPFRVSVQAAPSQSARLSLQIQVPSPTLHSTLESGGEGGQRRPRLLPAARALSVGLKPSKFCLVLLDLTHQNAAASPVSREEKHSHSLFWVTAGLAGAAEYNSGAATCLPARGAQPGCAELRAAGLGTGVGDQRVERSDRACDLPRRILKL